MNILTNVRHILLIIALAVMGTLSIATRLCAETTLQECQSTKPQEVWLTVFVHGIMSIKSHLTLSSFFRFMQDEMHDTIYAKTVDLMRQDAFFYQNQPMQAYGLHKVSSECLKGNSSYAMGWLFDIFHKEAGNHHISNHYYTFGWTGLLSTKQRYLDSVTFFEELEKEVQSFKDKGITPKVRVMGYSHGGNVSLNLALARRNKFSTSPLRIDELIMVGTPVQRETDYLICDQLFNKVYHIYSGSDFVQRLDVFCKDRYLSNRLFCTRKGFVLPNKLTQIQIKVTKPLINVAHCDKKESNREPLYKGTKRKQSFVRNDSPGHIELWFFGWTPHHYRDTYTFSPLPTIAITPYILHHIQQISCTCKPYQPILVDVRPYNEKIIIKQKCRGKKIVTEIPFIAKERFEQLKRDIAQFAPDEFTDELYRAHMHTAYNEAVLHYEHKDGLRKETGCGWLSTRKRYKKKKNIVAQEKEIVTLEQLPKKTINVSYFKF